MPSTSLGRLFLFDQLGRTARLTCLHSETGEELWQQTYTSRYEDLYGYSNGPRTTPVVDGDRVYSFGVEGRLRAHDVRDGRLLWDVDTSKTFGVVQNFFGVGSTPVIEGDLLIVMVGGSPSGSPAIHSGEVRGNGSAIVAFDKNTGAVRYRLGDELASYASPILTTLHGRRYAFAFTRGGLMAFDPTEGRQDFFVPWRAKKLESVNAASPVIFGDHVFITESYGPGGVLLQVGIDGPDIVWQDGRRQQAMASHWTTPIYHQGFLYGCSGQSSGEATLRCIDAETGKVLWSEPGLRRSTLLFVDDHFVVLGEYGELRVIEATPEAFRPVSMVDLGDGLGAASAKSPILSDTMRQDKTAPPRLRFPAWNAPVLSHGMLYVRGKDQLLAFDLLPQDGNGTDDPATKESP